MACSPHFLDFRISRQPGLVPARSAELLLPLVLERDNKGYGLERLSLDIKYIIVGQSWLSANLGFRSVRVCVSFICVSVLTRIEL